MGFWVRRLPPGSFSTSHASRSAAEARSKMHGRSKVYFESCDVCRCALAASGPSGRTEAPAGGTECVSRGTPAPCGRCREANVGRRAKKRATVSFGRPKSPGSRGSSEEECEPRRWRSAGTGKGGTVPARRQNSQFEYQQCACQPAGSGPECGFAAVASGPPRPGAGVVSRERCDGVPAGVRIRDAGTATGLGGTAQDSVGGVMPCFLSLR